MSTSTPGARPNRGSADPNTTGGPARVGRDRTPRGTETKPSYLTSELAVYVLAVLGVLIASWAVKVDRGAHAHVDYFRADTAWLYIVILTVGYLLSRGLAKAGSKYHGDDR
jgi:hypothetical protein